MQPLNQYPTVLAVAALKARVTSTRFTNFYEEDALNFYSVVFEFFVKLYVMINKVERIDANLHSLGQL